ncbi:nuclear pore complex protein NUP43-like isoform X2 [Ananas comosus]|uniref:Nuclear pore complex protein NUP43-like isoform X2 n=1 Tax=Ananas comosus TaxID=4615 RepID=A0A6P5EL57_ANACO|nr:nuclear pore complex protein NUP43-like isoform X2 [Ananas comosus]
MGILFSWGRGNVTGMVHSIGIHPSRKHICIVGGSFGTVFAWDLRWQQQLILLSGVGLNGTDQRVSESEVWEVQYDSYTQSSGITSAPSTKILPIMVCLEDGILAVLEQGEDPVELLAEPCAINAFDIDPQNPSDVVCALEWKNMAILLRGRDAMAI